MKNYDEMIPAAVKNITKVVPSFHSYVFAQLRLDNVELTDSLVNNDVHSSSHLFNLIFEKFDVNEGVTSLMELLEKEGHSRESLLLVPETEDEVYPLTAAWMRHFTVIEELNNRMENATSALVEDEELADLPSDKKHELLEATLAEAAGFPDHVVNPFMVVKKIGEDPALLKALHSVLHMESGHEILHTLIVSLEEAQTMGSESATFNILEAVSKYYSSKKVVDALMSQFALMNLMRDMQLGMDEDGSDYDA